MQPLELTVVLFAVPPEEMYILPPELIAVLFTAPPEETYIESLESAIPLEITPEEM